MTNKSENPRERLYRKMLHSRWVKIVSALASVVVFCTVYALILPAITMSNQDPKCGIEEHAHTAECYDAEGNIICDLEEHVHSLLCYSDLNAAIESEEYWTAELPALTGDRNADVIAVAKSQLGYKENDENYKVVDNEQTKGYTRYGHWYGDAIDTYSEKYDNGLSDYAYKDWDAMFVSFVLRYAEIYDMGFDSDAGNWAGALGDAAIYVDAANYVPQMGDLIFFTPNVGENMRVGIVSGVNRGFFGNEIKSISVILGDSNNAVEEVKVAVSEYTEGDITFETIHGYGVLTPGYGEQPEVVAEQATPVENADAAAPAEEAAPEEVAAAAPEGEAVAEAPEAEVVPVSLEENSEHLIGQAEENLETVEEASEGETSVVLLDAEISEDGSEIAMNWNMTARLPEAKLPAGSIIRIDTSTGKTHAMTVGQVFDWAQTAGVGIDNAAYVDNDNFEVTFIGDNGLLYSWADVQNMDAATVTSFTGIHIKVLNDVALAEDGAIVFDFASIAKVADSNVGQNYYVSKVSVNGVSGAETYVYTNGEAETVDQNEVLRDAGLEEKPEEKTLTAKKNDYTVTMTYGADAKIPDSAKLYVKEIKQGTDEFNQYIEDAKAALGISEEDAAELLGRFFDIKIITGDGEFEPKAPVNVNIEYKKAIETENSAYVNAVHFTEEGAETIPVEATNVSESEDETARVKSVEFSAESFSVYGVVYTVDFETVDGITWSWPGEGSYSIKSIMSELNVSEPIQNVSLVRTINSGGADNVLYLEEKEDGWYLRSDAAFTDTFKLMVKAGEKIYIIKITDAQTVTNLASTLESAVINGKAPGETVNLKVGDKYTVNLVFKETDDYQFNMGSSLTYKLPVGLTIPNAPLEGIIEDEDPDSRKIYAIHYSIDANGNITYDWIVRDQAKFDEIVCNSERTFIKQDIEVEYDGSSEQLVWNTEMTTDVNPDRSHDAKVSKSSKWNPDTQKMEYTVKVESDGVSQNINITDTISGSALTFDKNVTTTSNIQNTVAYTSDNKGFTVNIPKLTGGQSIEFKYTASVDLDKLIAAGSVDGKYGTPEATGNTVAITSVTGDDGTPENNTATTENNHNITISSVEKSGVASTEVVDGKRTVTWTVILNKEQLKNLAGTPFTDTINADSASMVSYSGDGITVQRQIKNQWGNLENSGDSYEVKWGTNGLTDPISNDAKTFTYTFPSGDTGTNYAYKITYTTDVDVSNIIADTEIKNDGTTNYGEGTGKATVGPTEENKVDLSKSVSSVDITTKTIEWDVTFQVPAAGLDSAVVTDTLPFLQFYDGETNPNDYRYYYDKVDSYTVTGLIDGEDFDVTYTTQENHDKTGTQTKIDKTQIIFTFTKNNQPGLFGGNEARPVTVHLVTTIPDEWLDAVANEYVDRTVHTNIAKIDANGKSVTKTASVDLNPTEPELVKRLVAQMPDPKSGDTNKNVWIGGYQGDGVEAFGYRIYIYGLTDESFVDGKLVITDTFPAEYLEYTDTTGKGSPSANGVIVNNDNIYNHQGCFSYADQIGGGQQHVTNDQEISDVAINGDTITFTIDKEDVPMSGGLYYPEYSVSYFLNIKSAKVREQMNEAAKAAGGTLKLHNIATSATMGDSEVDVNWEVPIVSKEKEKNLEKNNTYTFTVKINQGGDQLGSEESLTFSDTVTNLSVDYNTIHFEPESAVLEYDYKGNTITFKVVNATPITLTYDATVIKSGNFSNIVEINGQTAEQSGNETVSHGGSSGIERTPTLRVKKYEKGNMMHVLPGAEFAVYPFDSTKPGNYDSTQDPILTQTTNINGEIVISKKNSILFDTRYVLHEVTPPTGYKVTHDYYFTISSGAADYGNYVYFQNDVMPVDELPEDETETNISVKKKWIDAEGQDITSEMDRPVTVRLYKMAEGSNSKSDAIEVKSITLTADNLNDGAWEYTFEHLDAGNTYFIAEDPVPGYTAIYSNNNVLGLQRSGSIDITNNEKDQPDKTDIEVLKSWQNPDGIAIDAKKDVKSIRVQLKRKVLESTPMHVCRYWGASYYRDIALPSVGVGSVINVTYAGTLNNTIGFGLDPDPNHSSKWTWIGGGGVSTCTYTVPEGFEGELWFNANNFNVDDFTFSVEGGGNSGEYVDDVDFNKNSDNSYDLSEENHWSFARVNLPLTENGNTYQYYVEEMEVTYTDNHTETIIDQFEVKYKVGDGEFVDVPDNALVTDTTGVITIANRYEAQEEVQLSGSKTWIDGTGANRPDELEIKLFTVTGTAPNETETQVALQTEDSDAEYYLSWTMPNAGDAKQNVWNYTITHLPKYDDGGETLIRYRVKETVPTNYVAENGGIANDGTVDEDGNITGADLTNTELTEFEFSKIWTESGSSDALTWPDNVDSITVNLTQTAKGVTPAVEHTVRYTVTKYDITGQDIEGSTSSKVAGEGYTYKIINLPKYYVGSNDSIIEWVYAVSEKTVSGYNEPKYFKAGEQEPVGGATSVDTGGTIRNELITVTLPETGGIGTRVFTVTGGMLLVFSALLLIFRKKHPVLSLVNVGPDRPRSKERGRDKKVR